MNTALPQHVTEKLQVLHNARAAHNKNFQALSDVVAGIARCQQQQKDTELESHEAESQWRTLFRKLRGEITPELQAQHDSRISKRELAKEFDGLIEEMELDKMELHLKCGSSAPILLHAHRTAITAFAEHTMDNAVDAFSKHILNTDVINACVVAACAYSVYQSNATVIIGNRLLKVVAERIAASMGVQRVEHPVLKEIVPRQPEASGVLAELQNSPIRRMQAATRLAEQRLRLQQRESK